MTEATETLQVTNLEDLKKVRQGELVELPAFLDGTPFVVKLRRPSILRMAQLGQIPDEMQPVIDELLMGQSEKSSMEQRAAVYVLYASLAMEEPKFEDVEDVIDSFQLATIWHWGVFGPAMMEPFRQLRDVMGEISAGPVLAAAEKSEAAEADSA